MKKQSIIGLFALSLILLASACKNDKFQTTETGLEYKYIVKSDTGEVAGEGGYLEMHIIAETQLDSTKKDTVLSNSYTDVYGPSKMLVAKPTYDGCINEGFGMLKAGDSVVFRVNADSLYTKTFRTTLPPFLTGKEIVTITTKVLKSKNKETFDKEQKEEQENKVQAQMKLLENEQKQLKEVAEKMGYGETLELSTGGLYFAKIKETNGAVPKKGDVAKLYYKGMFLDGSEFDSNIGSGQPLPVTIGRGGVIAGWLEVVEKIKKGEKWIVFIPSSLAYGEKGSGKIGPNTPLIFEMELVNIQTAEEAKKEQEAIAKKRASEEDAKIKNYIRGKNFTKDKEIEVYYNVVKEGSGESAEFGDNIVAILKSYDFTGKPIPQFTMESPALTGPFTKNGFPPALETALKKIKKGGMVKVATPSRHFQGEQGGSVVGPFTPVFFELELQSIEKAK